MAEDKPEAAEAASAETQAVSRAEQHIIRLTFWQTILSVVGVVIAVIALYAALTESSAVRQKTSAAVWPFVQLMVENYDNGDAAGLSLAFTNAGVGPAKMQDVRLSIDGSVTRNWSELVASVDGEADAPINRNFISDRVLRPEETVVMFSTSNADLARKLIKAINKPRGIVTYCYCSIFDDCWLADSRKGLEAPDPVTSCPDFGADTYVN